MGRFASIFYSGTNATLSVCPSIILLTNSQVLSNLVNYKSFGFTKFIPRVPSTKFSAVVGHSANAATAGVLWTEVSVLLAKLPLHLDESLSSSKNTYMRFSPKKVSSSASVAWAMYPTIISVKSSRTRKWVRCKLPPRPSMLMF